MGKIKLNGFVPKDDPMFRSGPQMFSRPDYIESLKSSEPASSGALPKKLNPSAKKEPPLAESKPARNRANHAPAPKFRGKTHS